MRMKTATVSPTSMTSSQPEQVATETLSETQNSAQSDVSTIAWSPDGHFIASGSNDSTVWVRNVITRKIALKKQQPAEVQSVAWSPDGTKIASGDQDGSLQVWNSTTSHLIANAGGSSSPQQMSISWSPDNKKIVATGAKVWDATTGKLIFTYSGAETGCPVAWSPDGKFIAASYTSGTVVDVWNTTTGELITQHEYQTIIENVLAWSPDSKKIASLALDGVEIWDPVPANTYLPFQDRLGPPV